MTAPTGLIDLEKELTCSICTELLYQPLTLLDCLHTFCGSCLKEWFGWQKQNADKEHARDERHHHSHGRRQRRRKPYVLTCPSCRAVVRETRPNATVTTLLDMYLAANPDKAKSAKEKGEIAMQYTHGENIVPRQDDVGTDEGNDDDEASREEAEDRRLVDQVREVSLREIGAEGSENSANRGPQSPRRRTQHDAAPRTRATELGHQSSLRSLLSPYDSEELKDQILRQIAEEGLLDDIDWDNMEVEQEDEISERIAQAYRRRRRDRSRQGEAGRREEQSRREHSREPHASGEQQQQQQQHPPRRSTETASYQARATGSRPPTSYLRSAEASDSRPRPWHHRRRSSSQGRGLQPPEVSEVTRNAARSATDLSARETPRDQRGERRRRASHGQRSSTDPEGVSVSEQWRRVAARPNQPPSEPTQGGAVAGGMPSIAVDSAPTRPVTAPQTSQTSSSSPPPAHSLSVSCDRCGRANIETSLHYCCAVCRARPSTYDLCIYCYRQGKGCLHWYGFGYAAWPRYERLGSPGSEPPHVLRSQKYLSERDAVQNEQARRDLGLSSLPQGDLVLQRGVFCDVCQQNANTCYWHCDLCNDGEWGFCHGCVNQAKHCTHPLLPLALQTAPSDTNAEPESQLRPLNPPTSCNNCQEDIPAPGQRLHCPDCEAGDYDICMACYRSLVNSGRIKAQDGLHGWRRCPNGHRMLVVNFVERDGGLWWRQVVDGVPGGWSLSEAKADEQRPPQWSWRETDDGRRAFKEDQRRNHRPTDPAVSDTKRLALWSWVPDEGVKDELAFPKGAIITEVVDINGDFLWGFYCRAGGLFPAGYVRAVE